MENSKKLEQIIGEVNRVVIGKEEIVSKVLMAVLAGGHILVEDIPGVGKTTMALAFSRALSLDYNRLQFTPDVLPTDVVGFSLYNKSTGEFDYKPGVVMCNLFLADEINRTSSKTQSALLETMEEGTATVDGVTRSVPKPFTVIATQNPIGSVGTHMLPESQLDRFMVKLSLGYPNIEDEITVMKSRQGANPIENVVSIATAEDLLVMQKECESVFISDKMYRYIAQLSDATRTHPLIKLGISPRGALALAAMSRARAYLGGRNYIIPDDVFHVFKDVCEHRIILGGKAKLNNATPSGLLEEILKNTEMPRLEA